MTRYGLYLESGPKHKKTMVHVIDLMGCVATGSTSELAIAATPEAIRAFHRFLDRHGETYDFDGEIETVVVEHITEGVFIGNGTPYVTYGPDLDHLTDDDIERFLRRIEWLYAEMTEWAASLDEAGLAFAPPGGRSNRELLLHVMGAQPSTLSIALGSAPGFGKIRSLAERSEMPVAEALARMAPMVRERVLATTAEERNAVRRRDSGTFTLRKSLRGSLEHLWDHLTELSRRPDGPVI